MATFPRLSTNAVTQYPSARRFEAKTQVMRFVDGTEQRFRTLSRPQKRWMLRLDLISDEEYAALERFFEANGGADGEFTFVDPWDGQEYPDCSFDMESFEAQVNEHGRVTATVMIRKNQV